MAHNCQASETPHITLKAESSSLTPSQTRSRVIIPLQRDNCLRFVLRAAASLASIWRSSAHTLVSTACGMPRSVPNVLVVRRPVCRAASKCCPDSSTRACLCCSAPATGEQTETMPAKIRHFLRCDSQSILRDEQNICFLGKADITVHTRDLMRWRRSS